MLFIRANIKNRKFIRAAKRGKTNTVKTLLNKGVDVNTKDANGMTALMWAAYKCNFDTVEFLLDSDADTYTKDKNGNTAIKLMEMGIHTEIAELVENASAKGITA